MRLWSKRPGTIVLLGASKTQCSDGRSAWGRSADEVQVRPGVTGRGAIVLLGASLRKGTRRDSVFRCVPGQADAIQLNEQCVVTQLNKGSLRVGAGMQKKSCVWSQTAEGKTASLS